MATGYLDSIWKTAKSLTAINSVSVMEYGAVGDGVTDDTLAFQTALLNELNLYIPSTSNGYLINGSLNPRTNQVIYCDGYFVPKSDTIIWDFASCLYTIVHGTLLVNDKNTKLLTQPAFQFRSMCRWMHLDKVHTYGVKYPVRMVDMNESRIDEMHFVNCSGTGVTVTNNGTVCNVHDNTFGSLFCSGSSATGQALLFNSSNNGTIGGNIWQNVVGLGMVNTILVENSGYSEQWFGTVIADSCTSYGVHFYGGTHKFFIDTLWSATNGDHGLFANGANSSSVVDRIQISKFYAHDNTGAALYHNGWCQNWQIGELMAENNADAAYRYNSNTSHIWIGSLVSLGNSSSLRDDSDATSTDIYVAALSGDVTALGVPFPSLAASGVAMHNPKPRPAMAYVSGGTVTGININGVATGLITGAFYLAPMDTITITYSVTPTLNWSLV